MMSSIRKATGAVMANISTDGGITLPGWFLKVCAGALAVLILIGGAGLTSWAQVGQNSKDIANHEGRIVKLEEKTSDIATLAERLKSTNDRLDDTNNRIKELNDRLDAILSKRSPRDER